jgi:hypothetical protein
MKETQPCTSLPKHLGITAAPASPAGPTVWAVPSVFQGSSHPFPFHHSPALEVALATVDGVASCLIYPYSTLQPG